MLHMLHKLSTIDSVMFFICVTLNARAVLSIPRTKNDISRLVKLSALDYTGLEMIIGVKMFVSGKPTLP